MNNLIKYNNNIKTNKILEEIYIYINISNKIIMKKEMIKRLTDIFNKSNINRTSLLLNIIYFIWMNNDKKLLEIIKNGIRCRSEFESYFIDGLSTNYSISLSKDNLILISSLYYKELMILFRDINKISLLLDKDIKCILYIIRFYD